MFINSDAKYIYLDVPRTGSHSMGAMLKTHYGGALCRRHQWPELWRVFPRWFVFATVRNPFSRFVSLWRFATERRKELAEPWRTHLPAGTPEELLVWLVAHSAAVHGRSAPWTRIVASQSAYLDQAKATPDLIVRLESAGEDVTRLPFYRAGVDFPWRNRSDMNGRDDARLSGLSQDLVRKLYAEDFSRFGYSTDVADIAEPPKGL